MSPVSNIRQADNQQREVAKREAVEVALGASQEIFRLFVDAVGDYAIFVLDTRGLIQTWNKGARRLKGYESSEVIGTHFSRFYTPEDLARNHPAWELEQAAMHGVYEEEGWRVKKDGSRFWVSVVITALRDSQGVLQGFGKVTRDLTHKKIAEDQLKESEERFRLMIEGVKDYAIFALDPKGNVATWNEGAKRCKGYEAHEIVGKHFSNFYPPEDIEAKKPEMELRAVTKTGRFEDTGWRIRKDGSRFWANVVITAIRDKDNRLIGFSKVTRDLTERKKAEDQLRNAYASLEARVTQRTKELKKAKEEAERALQSRDEFLSIASHELRTPLTSLKLKTQIASRTLQKRPNRSQDAVEFQEFAGEIDCQIDRLARLIDDLLDLTRISQGTLKMEFEDVDLSDLVKRAVARIAPQFDVGRTPLELVKVESVKMSIDPMRIEQMISNILSNALRYAPGTLVQVSLIKAKRYVQLRIKDQGPGIAPENHEQIFNRFERVESSEKIIGLGIGLYLSRLIVRAHSGKIFVESELGKGATFVVELPYASKPTSSAT